MNSLDSTDVQPPKPVTLRLVLPALLICYLLTATLYNLAIPIGEAPDEPAHIAFVEIILKTGQLPTIPKESPRYNYEAEQPPLYYWLEAAWLRLLWPNDDLLPPLVLNPEFSGDVNFSFELRNAPNNYLHDYPASRDLPAHLMRFFSTLLGLATLMFIWFAARLAWPDSRAAALFSVGFAAFLPGFSFTSATVTNDALAATTGAAVLLGCVYMLTHRLTLPALLGTGAALGVGMLSKRSLIVLLPVLILVPLLVPSQTRRRCLLAMAALIAIALLIGIWPLVANLFTYGDPMATAATFAAKPELTYPLEGRPGYWLSLPYHLAIYNSLWGAFGIRSIDLPNVLYALYYVLCLLGIVGFIRHRSEINTSERRILMVLVFTFVLINIGVAYQNTQFWAVQGRLLLPGFAALVLLVGRGLYFVGKDILVSPRSKHITLALLLAVFIAADIYALIQFIVRVYYT